MKHIHEKLERIDARLIHLMRRLSMPFGRWAIFIVFFWFGLLKVLAFSPASLLVTELLGQTLPFIQPDLFMVGFGLFEMLIGILFLIRGMERIAIAILFFHMIAVFSPLILLPQITWSGFLVPTMEGQYIIKNLVIIGLAMTIAAQLDPLKSKYSTSPQPSSTGLRFQKSEYGLRNREPHLGEGANTI